MSSEVRYLARGAAYTAFLTDDGVTLALRSGSCGGRGEVAGLAEGPAGAGLTRESTPCRSEVVRIALDGGARVGRPVAEGPLQGRSNYFRGNDPSRWRRDVPHHSSVRYENVYPGIDLVFRPSGKNLRYDFEVRPGGDPARIRLRVEGAASTALESGRLVHRTAAGGRLEHRELRATAGASDLPAAFRIDEGGRVRFHVDRWSGRETLVIDPTLVWGTYLGGGGKDAGQEIAVDAAGNAYVVGDTESSDFPTTAGALDTTFGGSSDVFVAKLDPTGSALVYCTLLGGAGEDRGRGIAIDPAGNAYVVGYTLSIDFPTTAGAFDTTANGFSDVFAAKLNASGSALLYSTLLGGQGYDLGFGIAVDDGGNAHLTGYSMTTCSSCPTTNNYPATPGAFDPTMNGYHDVFVTKLNPSGTALLYSGFVGGSDDEEGHAIALDGAGGVYVAGQTRSTGFPTTAGAYDGTQNGDWDVFLTRVNPSGTAVLFSTLLGGARDDYAAGVTSDASSNAYVSGRTLSTDYPTTPGAFATTAPGPAYSYDGFVTKVSPTGTTLVYSTFLGGSDTDTAVGIVVDASGSAVVTGYTQSPGFPTTAGAFDRTIGGGNSGGDAYVAKLSPSGDALVASTFLGGDSAEGGAGVAFGPGGDLFVAGSTWSADFPTTVGAFDRTHSGGQNVFVTRLNASGSALSYSTLLGASEATSNGSEHFSAIAVDASGSAVVTGWTIVDYDTTSAYPTTSGAFDTTQNGFDDVVVAKLTPSGDALAYSTFLGGSSSEEGYAIALDGEGNAYVTGATTSVDFPTTLGAYDRTPNGSSDGFVVRLSPSGSALLSSTFLGGSSYEQPTGISVSPVGVHVTGGTASADFPTTAGAWDRSLGGTRDVFVARLDPSLSSPTYSTFLGGSGSDWPAGIATDASGSAYLAGQTGSADFPATPGAFDTTFSASEDVFVTKLNPSGSALVYSTFLEAETARAVAVDSGGNAYVTGTARNFGLPTTVGAFDTTFDSPVDAYVTKLNATGTGLVYSTYLGGSFFTSPYGQIPFGSDDAYAIAVDASGNAWVTGGTNSEDFPTTPDAFDRTQNGGILMGNFEDVFVSKLDPSGSALLYSTFLGGPANDRAFGIALDAAGAVYVAGTTWGGGFPTTPGASSQGPSGSFDGFVARIGPHAELRCGAPVSGSLDSSDSASGHRGSLFRTDSYYLKLEAGQVVTIDMASTAFDTYLLLVDPSGNVVAEDDNSGVGTNARIGGVSLTQPGTWVIEATSSAQMATGVYTLSVLCDCATYSIFPASVSPEGIAGSSPVAVTGQAAGCSGGTWTATANAAWLSVDPPSGTVPGTVTVSWTQNGGSARSGTVTIGGSTFTVRQDSAPCASFTLSPALLTPAGGPGTAPVSLVGSPAGCVGTAWTAATNDSWLSVEPSSGSGPSAIRVAWTANHTGTSRSGTATVGGNSLSVTQGSGMSFYALAPCRLIDTRGGLASLGWPPIAAAGTPDRAFPLLLAWCWIPATARAVSLNVTVVNPTADGDVLVYPTGAAGDLVASTLAFQAGTTRAAVTTSPLPADGSCSISVRNRSAGWLHLVVDVTGYFSSTP